MNNEEILKLIKEDYYRINPKSCGEFFKKRNKKIPCLPKLQELFNATYNEILILSGISDDELKFVRRSKEEYLEKLKKVSHEIGHIPSPHEFTSMGYSPEILKKHFGSYENAARMIDEKFNYKSQLRVIESKEELLRMYIDFSNKIGKPASTDDLCLSNGIYPSWIFAMRFGSIPDLKKIAGFTPVYTNKITYTKQYIKKILKELYLENKKRLSVKEMINNDDLPCLATILRNFHTSSIKDVWREIDLVKCKIIS